MRTFDIMFYDLVPETQKEVLKFLNLKTPVEGNLDVFPLTMISQEDVEDINKEAKKKNKKNYRTQEDGIQTRGGEKRK